MEIVKCFILYSGLLHFYLVNL